jgi:histone-lysine N-methyltransferase SETMAR
MTEAAIQEFDWEILPHPPYSLDLAQLDYHLFRPLSNNLSRDSFNNYTEFQNWLDNFFMAKPADFFKRGTENLPKRWEAVVNNGEEYMID